MYLKILIINNENLRVVPTNDSPLYKFLDFPITYWISNFSFKFQTEELYNK